MPKSTTPRCDKHFDREGAINDEDQQFAEDLELDLGEATTALTAARAQVAALTAELGMARGERDGIKAANMLLAGERDESRRLHALQSAIHRDLVSAVMGVGATTTGEFTALEVAADLHKAVARLEKLTERQWQPIATSMPLSSRPVIAWGVSEGGSRAEAHEAFYSHKIKTWETPVGELIESVTHWQPLPPAPVSDQSQGE